MLRPTAPYDIDSNAMSNGLFINMYELPNEQGRTRYHWTLYCTGNRGPAGDMFHATDAGRRPMDLYYEHRPTRDPTKSATMVVSLKIAHAPPVHVLKHYAAAVRLMNLRYLPRDEVRWSCRVWVKELLKVLSRDGHISLPLTPDALEERCFGMADRFVQEGRGASIFTNLGWMTHPDYNVKIGSATSYVQRIPRQPYYGSKPMDIDPTSRTSSQYYGSKPMALDSTW